MTSNKNNDGRAAATKTVTTSTTTTTILLPTCLSADPIQIYSIIFGQMTCYISIFIGSEQSWGKKILNIMLQLLGIIYKRILN